MYCLTRICNGNSEQLVDDIADDLNRATSGLAADWVAHEETAAGQGCSAPDFGMIGVEILQSTIMYKFIQHMACAHPSAPISLGIRMENLPLKSNVWRVVRANVIISGVFGVFVTSPGMASFFVEPESPRSSDGGAPSGL